MLDKDLIPNKYYCWEYNSNKYYFKYKFQDDEYVYSHGFEFSISYNLKYEYDDYANTHYEYKTINNMKEYIFCGKDEFNSYNLYEVDISEFINILPDSNLDKRNYIRRCKINTLLK